ncbi:xylosidase [Niastella vici]|uniref:Xylosidase n=1 Tax=Niastella vici TaxID=1703345 RepID=A0A1V9G007_9BACT|nr:TIM-barrel domain-containing protein [Niastella vici]OQP63951.1 xylosidase [Niastella vici]
MKIKTTVTVLLLLFTRAAFSQAYTQTNTGIKATVNNINVEIQWYSPRIVRIMKSPKDAVVKKESYSVIKTPENVSVNIQQHDNKLVQQTDSLQVIINLQTGRVSFGRPGGEIIFSEKDHGTQFTPIIDLGKNTYDVRQAFFLDKDEMIYGLGQQQNGKMNQRGQKLLLLQKNTKVCIPFFQSTKGYGVFWDNYSPTLFTDNPQETSFDSEVGDCSDYYFLLGNSADGVIAQMRQLTGQSPMMPLWVYGFNQSRERYKTQFELVDVVQQYRTLQVPLDGIIQDWQYWGDDSIWNAMAFDPVRYPRPKLMADSVHAMNAHLFIVAWPVFGYKTAQFAEFKKKNMLINFETWPKHTRLYDAYNPVTRDSYWEYLNKGVFSQGTDGWWLDDPEPDHLNHNEQDYDQPTYAGSFRSVCNALPLLHAGGIYTHQRQTTSAKRVAILTRSAFAGQQRYGANTWSGDVRSDWSTLHKQIAAGLNFSLCGIPYWNTDIGGFIAEDYVNGGTKNPEFQELYIRWLQFATFTPMMRSHGTILPREIYQFGQRGEWPFDVQEKFINLRYSLLPYVYATAWQVTANAGSIMRALYCDFASDPQALDINNEFMFGKSFLVAPVTQKGVKEQVVYLPAGTRWFNFWTGDQLEGGQSITEATPIDKMPLYVKAGSIIPWGPRVQYAEEKKWDNLELRIYPGTDGHFTLYEDENDNYNYENGQYTEIDFHWNDQTRMLTINDIRGSFPRMLQSRKFNIVIVNKQNGTGAAPAVKFNKTVTYKGRKTEVRL